MFDQKVRLRSDAELETQNEGLIIIKKTLEEIKVKHFLSSGTLLGAVREKNFIRWDWDVQMYLLMENAYPLRDLISKSLTNKGFYIKKYYDSKVSLKWGLRRKNVKYELTAWYKEGIWRYRKNKKMRVPAYLFEGNYIINFRGMDYPTLNPPEEYLEFCYGNWKKPIRTSNKEAYSTNDHMRDYTSFNKFISFLKNILINIKKNLDFK
jgi:lipopolysaccharide cholinephosphotransferase